MKQLGAGELGWQAFQFQGNVSYNPGGTFEVPVSGPAPSHGFASFVRASTASSKTVWSFQELPQAGSTQAAADLHDHQRLGSHLQHGDHPRPA
ncbi:MAG TPA: hypothetical protein VFC03_12305 [Acidimicrobiales bacterium]|nr:hypothetical protein [Acidimicrobiales bacterium]